MSERIQEELNYNEAYTFLFNNISDMVDLQITMMKQLLILQKQCEEICIGNNPENLSVESGQVLALLIDIIKQKMEDVKGK